MFLLMGAAAGALTGVPIGPANVAVIDAAYRHTLRRAIAVAFGAALADGLYAAGGALGVAPLIRSYPSIPPILYAVSGVVLLVYGFITARNRPVQPAPPSDGRASQSTIARRERREMWSGFTVGLALILLNPAAVVTWVLIMGSMIPVTTQLEGAACAIGVVLGSFGWFALVAYLTNKGKSVLGEKVAWIPRVIGFALMGYAVYLLVRAAHYVIA